MIASRCPECGLLQGPLVNDLLDHMVAEHQMEVHWYDLHSGRLHYGRKEAKLKLAVVPLEFTEVPVCTICEKRPAEHEGLLCYSCKEAEEHYGAEVSQV